MQNFVTIKEIEAQAALDSAWQRHWRAVRAGDLDPAIRVDAARNKTALDAIVQRCRENLMAAGASTAGGRAKAQARLDAVNGKARAHTVDLGALVGVAIDCERRLDAAGIPRRDRAGVSATYSPAGPSARSYKWRVASTNATIRRGASGWGLVEVERVELLPQSPEDLRIWLSPAQAETVRAKAMVGFLECAA